MMIYFMMMMMLMMMMIIVIEYSMIIEIVVKMTFLPSSTSAER